MIKRVCACVYVCVYAFVCCLCARACTLNRPLNERILSQSVILEESLRCLLLQHTQRNDFIDIMLGISIYLI